jgi:hypothetical protein
MSKFQSARRYDGHYESIQIGLLQDPYGLDMILIQGLSMSYFLKSFNISLPIIFCIAFVIIILNIIISIITASVFMNPIFSIMDQAEDI